MVLNRSYLPLTLIVLLILCLCLSACEGQAPPPTPIPCSPEDLIQAILDANSDPDLSVITLEADCTINFLETFEHVYPETGNALPNITSPINLIGNGGTLVAKNWGTRFFWILSTGNLRLEHIKLESGSGSDFSEDYGGAIYNDGGGLTLHNVTLFDNQSDYGGAVYNQGSLIIEAGTVFHRNHSSNGGAIYNASSAGVPIIISDSAFNSNSADSGPDPSGGAIYNAGTNGAGIFIGDTIFDDNLARKNGGAIYNADVSSPLQITAGSFIHNKSNQDGGAIYLEAGNLTLSGTSFNSNHTYQPSLPGLDPCGTFPINQKGGAISVHSGNVFINQCIFDSNWAEYEGGAIYNESGSIQITDSAIRYSYTFLPSEIGNLYSVFPDQDPSTSQGGPTRDTFVNCNPDLSFGGCISNHGSLAVNKSSLSDCSSMIGGGLANHENASAILTNVVMFQNLASIYGGQIFNNSEIFMNFVTLLEGESGQGGSLFNRDGNTQVKNCIFEPGQGTGIDNCVINGGTFSALGENIDSSGDCPGFSIQADPRIEALTGDYFLSYTLPIHSPALGAAVDCTDLAGNPVSEDTRGEPREDSAENPCEIGAIEAEELASSIDVELGPQLTAPKNLTCREGDHNDYTPLGYLLEGESTEVIGRNQDSTWLVINNPDWDGICWIFLGNIILEGDLDGTQIYTAPPLVLDQDPSGDSDDEPAFKCSGYLSPEECKAAGGTYKISWSPPCKCP